MGQTILMIIIMVPFYAILIWNYMNPEESLYFGQRWKYNKEPEYSEEVIRLNKFISMIGIFIVSIILVRTIFDSYFAVLLIVLGLTFYIMYGGYKLFTKGTDK